MIELAIDKVPSLYPTRDEIMQPIKIVLGGVVFAAAMAPDGWIAMVVSAVLGLIIAGLADQVRRSTRSYDTREPGALILMSIYEDVVVLVGTLLFVLVPLIGALVAFFLLLLAYRVQRRGRRKHKGLRILRG